VWPIDGEWWGVLYIDPAFADRADEILASLEPVAAVAPPATDSPVVPTTTPESASDPTSKPADAPSYVLNDPAFSGPRDRAIVRSGGVVTQSMVWNVEQTGPDVSPAYVFAAALDLGAMPYQADGVPYQADGVTYQDVSRNGVEAVLYIGDTAATPPRNPVVYFPQDDGVVWVFEAANLVADASNPYGALVDLAFALSNEAFASGSGSTPALPTTLFGQGTRALREFEYAYTTATGGDIYLTVQDGFEPFAPSGVTGVTATTVLGRPALAGTWFYGSTEVVWQSADGSPWWVTLTFSDPATYELVDQVIASLELVTP
jgi:hypothetical protein